MDWEAGQTSHQRRYTQLASKHTRRGSAACATWEIQGKSSGTPPTTHLLADQGPGRPQHHVLPRVRGRRNAQSLPGGCRVVQPPWETVWQFVTTLNRLLPFDSSGRTPWHLPKGAETLQYTKMCTQTFTAALFIIAKTWKQPGCPSAADAEKAVVRPDNGMLSALKRDGL